MCTDDVAQSPNMSAGVQYSNSCGRTAPTAAAFLVLPLALETAMSQGKGIRTRTRVGLADLVQFDGFVEQTDSFAPGAAKLAEVCKGNSWPNLGSADIRETVDVDRLLSR